MHLGIKLAIILLLTALNFACLRQVNLNQGIACFRAQNYRQAFIHLKPAAEKGYPEAQYAVGFMYYYGQGVIEDRRRACFWINKAAQAGQTDAIRAMDILMHEPKFPDKDPLNGQIYNPAYM